MPGLRRAVDLEPDAIAIGGDCVHLAVGSPIRVHAIRGGGFTRLDQAVEDSGGPGVGGRVNSCSVDAVLSHFFFPFVLPGSPGGDFVGILALWYILYPNI